MVVVERVYDAHSGALHGLCTGGSFRGPGRPGSGADMMSEFGSDPNADMQDGTRGLVAAVVVACTGMGCLQEFG